MRFGYAWSELRTPTKMKLPNRQHKKSPHQKKQGPPMRIINHTWTIALLLLISFGNSFSQNVPNFNGKDANTPEAEFSMTVSKSAENICVGDEVTVTFTGKINTKGWHLYSARQDGNISYNPTELFLFDDESKGGGLSGKMTENKKPHSYEDELMGGTIREFKEQEIKFTQKIKITDPDVNLSGEFSAQTCCTPEMGGMCKFLKLDWSWKFTAKECKEESATTSPTKAKNENGGKNDQTNHSPEKHTEHPPKPKQSDTPDPCGYT